MTILVIGARCHIGGGVLHELLEASQTVRASSRDPKPGDFPEGVEVVRADLTHHQYPQADHAFYANEPVETVREVLTEIVTFFRLRLIEST